MGDLEHLGAAGVGKTWLRCILSSVAFAHRSRAGGVVGVPAGEQRRGYRIQYAPTYVYLRSLERATTTRVFTRPEEVDDTPTGRRQSMLLDRKSVRLI